MAKNTDGDQIWLILLEFSGFKSNFLMFTGLDALTLM